MSEQTLTKVAAPTTAVATVEPSPTTIPPRGKSIVNGRPTALHPWKRYGYERGSLAPRNLRVPR